MILSLIGIHLKPKLDYDIHFFYCIHLENLGSILDK